MDDSEDYRSNSLEDAFDLSLLVIYIEKLRGELYTRDNGTHFFNLFKRSLIV
jgi:hypothetical protein